MDPFWQYLNQLSRMFIFFGPLNLVCLFGMILALLRLKRYGKPARLVAIGAGCIIFSVFLLVVWVMHGRFISRSIHLQISHKTDETLGLFIWSLTTSVGMSLILWAAFTGRTAPPRLDD